MKLKCVLKDPKIDFVPMIKGAKFWISPETLRSGSVISVADDLGHQLLANYIGAFEVVSYGEEPKKRSKQIKEEDLKSLEVSEA